MPRPTIANFPTSLMTKNATFHPSLGLKSQPFGMPFVSYLAIAIALSFSPSMAIADESPTASFEELFNGVDLTGWAGKDGFWSVQDGAIIGQTTPDNPTKGNTFLVWQGGEPGDFVFKTKVRFEGNNSGVQYRSELIDPTNFVAKGYQADLHKSPKYFGMLYAEKWRGIVAQRFQKVVVGEDAKPVVVGMVGDKDQKLVDTQWNELTIVAVGNRQIHQVNGVTTMDLTDNHPEAKRSGIIALQLHAGNSMKVEFKDIRLRQFDGDAEAAAAMLKTIINETEDDTSMDDTSMDDAPVAAE